MGRVVLAMLMLGAAVSAPCRAATSWVVGVGTESCKQWTADQDGAVAQFVAGYFTAMNAAQASQGKDGEVGAQLAGSGLLAAVRRACDGHAGEAIAVATALTYAGLRAR